MRGGRKRGVGRVRRGAAGEVRERRRRRRTMRIGRRPDWSLAGHYKGRQGR